jgi:hypothetical protein
MKKIRLQIIVPVILLTFLLAWYGLLSVSFVRAGGAEGTDFHWFYSVGLIWRQYGPGHVYDLELAAPVQAEVAGVPLDEKLLLLPNHPPFVYPRMALLAGLPFRVAYGINIAYAWIFTALFSIAVYKLLLKLAWPRGAAFTFIIGLLFFEPFIISLLRGQDTYLLLVGGLLFLYGFLDKKDWLAGIGLGLVLIRPQVALLMAVPFLFRQRKIFWWFLASAGGLGLYSLLLVGWQGAWQYIQVLGLSTGVAAHGWDEVLMYNLVGLLIRAFPALDVSIIHTLGWVVFGLSLVTLCLLWRLSPTLKIWHITLAVSLSLFASPHLHYHDLALLLVSILGFGLVGIKAGRLGYFIASLLPMLVSILLVVGDHWEIAHYPLTYLLLFSLPVLTWFIGRRLPTSPRP